MFLGGPLLHQQRPTRSDSSGGCFPCRENASDHGEHLVGTRFVRRVPHRGNGVHHTKDRAAGDTINFLKKQIWHLNKQKKKQAVMMGALEARVRNLSKELAELKEKKQSVQEEADSLRSNISSLKRSLLTKEIEMKGLSSQLVKTQEQLQESRQEASEMQVELETAKQRQKNTRQERDKIEGILSTLDSLLEGHMSSTKAISGSQEMDVVADSTEEKMQALGNLKEKFIKQLHSKENKSVENKEILQNLRQQLLQKSTESSALEKQVTELSAQLVLKSNKISELERRERSLLAGQSSVRKDLCVLQNEAVEASEDFETSHGEYQALEEQLGVKESSLSEMRSRLMSQKALIATLEAAKIEMQAKITQLALTKIKLEEEKQQLLAHVEHLQAQLAPLENMLQKERNHVQAIETEMETMREKITQLSLEKIQLKQTQMKETDQDKACLQEKIQNLTVQLVKLEASERIHKMRESELCKAHAELLSASSAIEALQAEKSTMELSLTKQLMSKMQALEEMSSQFSSAQDKMKNLELQNDQLQIRITELEEGVKEKAKLNAQLEKLQFRAKELQRSNDTEQLQKEKLRQEIERLQKEVERNQETTKELRKRVVTLSRERDVMQERTIQVEAYWKSDAGKEQARLEVELGETKMSLAQAEADLDEVIAKKDEIDDELCDLQQQYETLHQENQQLHSQLRAIYQAQNTAQTTSGHKAAKENVSRNSFKGTPKSKKSATNPGSARSKITRFVGR